MSKVSLCPHQNVNWSRIFKSPYGIGDGLYVKSLTSQLTFLPSILTKKQTCCEISRGMCPTVIKLEKYLLFILIAQAYGSISNDNAVVSNYKLKFAIFGTQIHEKYFLQKHLSLMYFEV